MKQRKKNTMRSEHCRRPLSILLLFITLLLTARAPVASAAETADGTSTAITTTQVQRDHRFTTSITWFGQVESADQIDIVARVEGRVIRIAAADESAVRRGDLLFQLAGRDVANRAQNLQQQLAQATRAEAIARKNLQLKTAQRQQGLATNEQVNLARQALAQASGRRAAAKLAMAQMDVGAAITAPIAGIFTARTVHVGQYVQRGTRLARIIDPHHLRIRATLFPPAGLSLRQRPVLVQRIHAAGGVQPLPATISAVMPARTAQGASAVWIDGDALQLLAPGEQVSGVLPLTHSGFAVPAAALARDDAGHSYLFVRHGQQWRRLPVQTGLRDGRWVEIIHGVQGGESIAAEGAYGLLYSDFGRHYHEAD